MTYHSQSRSMTSQSEAWRELRGKVAARCKALNDEIRQYPRPIARCDEQLTRLIEQRDRMRALQERMTAVEASEPDAPRLGDIVRQALDDEEISVSPALKALIGGSA